MERTSEHSVCVVPPVDQRSPVASPAMVPSTLVLALDLLGILAFAVAGALAAVQHDLDIFGVFVLAGVTAVGGGLIRDAVLGATPAAALTDWRYLAVTGLFPRCCTARCTQLPR